MIKGVQAVKGELSELDKQLSDAFLHELQFSMQLRREYVQMIKSASCLTKCSEIFKKVSFLSFDVKEWITENDLLVHRLKEDDGQKSVKEVVDNFKSLLEKVQGLPPESSFICYELAIVYNLSHLLLRGHTNLPVGGHHKSTFILHKSLLRAFEAFEIGDLDQGASRDATDLFSVSNIDHTLKKLLPSLFQAFSNNNIGCAPLVLSCCLLAFVWLLDEHVNRVKAVQLLTLVQSHLKKLKDDVQCNVIDEVSSDRCPVHLFSLECIPSVTNCIKTSSARDLTDTQNLLVLVTSMLAFSHYANEDYDKVLTTLQERVEGQDVGFNDVYLKGYVFYVRNEVDKALSLFQQCVQISQGQNKAAALNMLGCCCAVKGKHHTAVSKFKEAMQIDFEQLEALFNICLQYRKLGNFTAEIQCLKLLKEAITGKVESEQCCNVAVISTDHGHNHRDRRLELTIPPRFALTGGMPRTRITTELITYMLAKRSAELGRFEESANSYLELLTNIVEMQSSNSSDTIHLPSPTELYRQCAVTLLNAGRYQDTLTVCDKVLTTSDSGKPTENGHSDEQNENSTAPRKRLRSNEDDSATSTDEESMFCGMLMLKAEAFIHLHQPLEALQALNRVLKTLEGVQSSNFYLARQDKEASEEQQRKRRRIDTGDSTLLTEQGQRIKPNELVKLKVRAYNQKASILEGLDQTHDALHELHLSLECLPDNPGTVYKHTQLLLKLSSEKEAAANWLRFRGIQLQHTKDVGTIKKALRSSLVRLVESDEVGLDEVQAMDEQILNWCKNTQEDPFIIYTFNRFT